MIQCKFEGCNKSPWARGLCKGHDAQLKRGRQLTPLKKYVKRGEPRQDIAYKTAHDRTVRLFGPARGYVCEHCLFVGYELNDAEEWAYKGASENERESHHGPYSPVPSDYKPLCTKCHRRMDAELRTL